MRCSNALVMRVKQIKSKSGSYLMLVDWKNTMSILPNVEWLIGSFKHCWWEYKLVQLLWNTVCYYHVKLNICITYNPSNLTPLYNKKFIAVLFIRAKIWRKTIAHTNSHQENSNVMCCIVTVQQYISVKINYSHMPQFEWIYLIKILTEKVGS